MKSTINYKVVSKSNKKTKRIDGLAEFIGKNFNVKGKRLGIPNFTKEFGKYNDEKQILQSSSVPTLTEIQIACRKVASEIIGNKSNNVIPCVTCKNGVSIIETHDASEFDLYYPTIKPTTRKEISPTEYVINYINKHADAIDFKLLADAINGMTE